MTETKLSQYLTSATQSEVAALLGVNQSAVSQMVRNERDVRIVLDADGCLVRAYEIKEIGNRAA